MALLTKPQAAQALLVSPRTLERMVASGRIRTVKVSRRAVRIPRSEFERITAPVTGLALSAHDFDDL